MQRRNFRDMPQVELVLIPDLGQPRSLPYSSVTEARLSARMLSRKGPQRYVAWYVLDDEGMVLSSHGYAIEALKMVRPDAHTQMDLVRQEEIGMDREHRALRTLELVDAERRAAHGLSN